MRDDGRDIMECMMSFTKIAARRGVEQCNEELLDMTVGDFIAHYARFGVRFCLNEKPAEVVEPLPPREYTVLEMVKPKRGRGRPPGSGKNPNTKVGRYVLRMESRKGGQPSYFKYDVATGFARVDAKEATVFKTMMEAMNTIVKYGVTACSDWDRPYACKAPE